MAQIALLVRAQDKLRLLQDWFSSEHQVVLSLPKPGSAQSTDLIIVDAPQLAECAGELRAARLAGTPGFLPVLCTVEPETMVSAMPFVGDVVDDVLVFPMVPDLAIARVQNMLYRRQLEQQLAEQSERLSHISMALESTTDAISIASRTHAPIYQNQSFYDLYGFDADDLSRSGIEHTLFTTALAADTVVATLQRGDPWHGVVDVRRKYGESVPTLVRAHPIRDHTGDSVGFMYIFTDITDRRRAEVAEQEQQAFADALHDTSTALTSTLDLEEVLDRILKNIGQVVRHDAANIMLVSDGTATIVRSHGYQELGVDEEDLKALPLDVSQVIGLRWMAETGRPLTISDAYTYAGWFGTSDMPWLRSYMGAPILLKGVVLGFLNLNSLEPDFFVPAQAARLQIFAEQAAIAIDNAQLHEKALALVAYQERQRLARDLHDGVNQMLFSASMISESLLYLWEREPQKVPKRLLQLHRLARGALVQMRTLLVELRPEELLEARFSDLLRQLVDAVKGRAQLEVNLSIDGEARLPDKVQTAFYYIALELFDNITSHARARTLDVHLTCSPRFVELRIRDDGRGFDLDAIETTKGGISIISDRAAAIGATLDIVSQGDVGTEVTATWSADERKTVHDTGETDTRAHR